MVIWYIFYRFGMFYQEKSGNPTLFETVCMHRKTQQTQHNRLWKAPQRWQGKMMIETL
jgi:hypothetical protein